MKKVVLFLAITATLAATATSALAHGHGGRGRHGGYSWCYTQGCTDTGLHAHNGITYAAHYYGDGHQYHGNHH